jgi:hypothetical protein
MTDPGNKRKFTIIDLILIVLFIVLVFTLYILFGGDLLALTRPETYTGNESLFDQFVGSLSTLGQGLRDSLGGMIR